MRRSLDCEGMGGGRCTSEPGEETSKPPIGGEERIEREGTDRRPRLGRAEVGEFGVEDEASVW